MGLIRSTSLSLLLVAAFSGLVAQPFATLEPVADGLQFPVDISNAGDGTERLFIAEILGRVQVLRDGQLLESPFLDISERVAQVDNGGLLGLAFHPDYESNQRFFVLYTRQDGAQFFSVISEFRASPEDPDRASDEERVILEIPRSDMMHVAGDLDFGPDGFLYISSGDSGPGGDPDDAAQSPASLLGKILRIDIDGEAPYAVPPDNPFVGHEGSRPEIWALGFRNPFRFSLDRVSGRLFVGDVGEDRLDEIDIVVRGGNYGWNRLEGTLCFPETVQDCPKEGFLPPDFEYGREDGGSVIGGVVYRGAQPTEAWGGYVYTDFISRRVWFLKQGEGGRWIRRQLTRSEFGAAAIGEDEEGEVYLADLLGGAIVRVRFGWQQALPIFADGGAAQTRYVSSVQVSNPHTEPVDGEIVFFSPEGDRQPVRILDTTSSSFQFSLPPKSSRTFVTSGQSGPVRNGWIRVRSDRRMHASLLLGVQNASGVQMLAGITPSPPSHSFVGHAIRSVFLGLSTALSIANPSTDEAIRVKIRVADVTGQPTVEAEIELDPLESRAVFVEELGDLPPEFEGTLVFESAREFVSTALLTKAGLPAASASLTE